MNIKVINIFNNEPKLNLYQIINTQKVFKRNVIDSVKELGHFEYKGYSYSILEKDKKYLYVDLQFISFSKKDRYKRHKYISIVRIPYVNTITDDIKIQVFSSDESFKYFLSYVLNKYNNVILNKKTKKYLGISLTKKPKIRNKKLNIDINKHLYKILYFIRNKDIKKFIK